jgi:hypothetical protein
MTEFDGGLDDERVKAFQREMLQATVVAEGFGRAMTRFRQRDRARPRLR